MKKRTLAALLGLTLAFTLTACGGTEEAPGVQEDTQATETVEDPALTAARQEMADSGSAFAVGYLGDLPQGCAVEDLLEDSGCLETYPFLADCPVVTYEGPQVFCLIPRSADTVVRVEEYICDESNNYQGEVGDVLFDSQTGQPVILVCNQNDVLPNLQVTLVETDGSQVVYNPSLELCGGTVFVPAGMVIQDVSNYEPVTQQQEETPAPAPAPSTVDFSGEWRAYEDFEGSRVVLDVIFSKDGSAEYLCGYADSEYLSDYQGTWYTITENGTYPAGSIVLDMKDLWSGTPFFGVFTVTAESGTITLTHVSGNTLIYGTDGQGITFSPYVN
ncbi:MAG: hypothetical protein IKU62_07020 [Ruminiclostridium sp.]|nr:hypothetical protein [Ruminiclostridium sp.]